MLKSRLCEVEGSGEGTDFGRDFRETPLDGEVGSSFRGDFREAPAPTDVTGVGGCFPGDFRGDLGKGKRPHIIIRHTQWHALRMYHLCGPDGHSDETS